MTDQLPHRFHLQRDTDVTGVSGTGIVALGVMWPDGTASVRWTGERPSIVFWDGGMADAEHVHGHGGATRIVWDDPQTPDPLDVDEAEAPELTAEEARAEVERLAGELYAAQDGVAYVREMCAIRARQQRASQPGGGEVSTGEVLLWLEGPKCSRMQGADAPTPGPTQCPTCGPTPTEPHPRLPGVDRCANCKTHATAVCSGEEGFCAVHGYDRHAPAPDGLRDQVAEALMAWAERNNAPQYAAMRRPDTVRQNAYSRADAVLPVFTAELQRLRAETATADQIRADVQRERDRLAATVERVRRLAERWENALLPDRSYARALRTALNESSDGAGADTARRCGSTLTHLSHKFMRLHVVFNCPGVTPEDPS